MLPARVKVRWMGHACFEISTTKVCIVTDPHDGEGIGLPKPSARADVVLVSHDHHDHIDGEGLVSKGWLKTKILRAFKGEREVKRVPIKGIKSFHDDVYGAKRGENVIYVFAVGGITFCHLGDLGHVLTDDQVAEIGSVNVLFVPVGGVYTVDAAQATRVVEQLRPNIAIPMHYKIHGLMQALATVDDFIRGKENVRILEASDIAMRRQDLPPPTWILVFRPPVSGVRPPAA